MSEVLAAIVHRLGEEYSRIELKSEDAKKRFVSFQQFPC
jgi:vacuolar protein sorting-associated protein 54